MLGWQSGRTGFATRPPTMRGHADGSGIATPPQEHRRLMTETPPDEDRAPDQPDEAAAPATEGGEAIGHPAEESHESPTRTDSLSPEATEDRAGRPPDPVAQADAAAPP